MLTFGSLFAGIGGFDLGFERAGIKCLWQVEIDDYCQQVLAKHWPDVKRYGDVRDVGKRNLETVDVICGGFPCQDVSVAGRREGLAGERSGLWFEFHRVIEETKPEWVVVENVPGLLSSNGGADFATILSGLAECGYWWAYRVLDAQYFGVPQRRRRVFIVASLTRGCAQEVLFERESSPWDIAPGRKAGEGIAGTAKEGIGIGGSGLGFARSANPSHSGDKGDGGINTNFVIGFSVDRDGADAANQLMPTLRHGGDEEHHHRAFRKPAIAYGGNNTAGPIDVAAARNAHGSNRYDFESETFIIKGAAIGRKPEAGPQYGEVLEGGSCYTLNSTEVHADGVNLSSSPFCVRRLTPTECEQLQGFPDGWTDDQSDSARYRQLGNAVAVPVAEWIGHRLVSVDNQPKS